MKPVTRSATRAPSGASSTSFLLTGCRYALATRLSSFRRCGRSRASYPRVPVPAGPRRRRRVLDESALAGVTPTRPARSRDRSATVVADARRAGRCARHRQWRPAGVLSVGSGDCLAERAEGSGDRRVVCVAGLGDSGAELRKTPIVVAAAATMPCAAMAAAATGFRLGADGVAWSVRPWADDDRAATRHGASGVAEPFQIPARSRPRGRRNWCAMWDRSARDRTLSAGAQLVPAPADGPRSREAAARPSATPLRAVARRFVGSSSPMPPGIDRRAAALGWTRWTIASPRRS